MMRSMTVRERDPGTWPLGPVLKAQREKLGLSFTKLAERSGLGRATVTYYETGFRADNGDPVNPTVKILRPLAEALELDLDYVLEVAELKHARRKTDEEAAAEVARRSAHLADRIAQLDPKFRSAVETIVDEYLRAQGFIDDVVEVRPGPAELRSAASAAGPDELPLGNRTSDQLST
jgi:transcriptional regulator with XRE-family HTH domain